MKHLNIEVMSRKEAVKMSFDLNVATVVISITDVEAEPANIHPNSKNNILAVLPLKFDDLDFGPTAMTEKDAEKIVNLINNLPDKCRHVVVHCEAGISRSAGVAAAIMKHLYGVDWVIFENPRYNPNMHCYQTLLEAFNQN